MKDMKIKARMILSLGFVALMALITVIVALSSSSVAANSYSEVIGADLQANENLLEARVHINVAARYARDMVLNGYTSAQEDQIEERLSQLDAALSAFVAEYPLHDGRDSTYVQSVNQWKTALRRIVSEVHTGDRMVAVTMLQEECTPALDQLTTQSVDMFNAVSTNSDAKLAAVQLLSMAMLGVAIGIAVLSIIITLILSFKLVKDITHPLSEAQAAIIAMSHGDLKYRTTYSSKNEIGQMIDAVRTSQKVLDDVIGEISSTTAGMADGNFDIDLSASYPGDLAPIRDSIRQLIQRMNDTLNQISNMADQVASGADQVSSGAQTLAQGATEQASSVVELSSTLGIISDNAKQNAATAQQSKEQSDAAGRNVDACAEHMKEMLTAMGNISDSTSKIAQIISTIEDIAFQTNILALNASVEAARAGSAGKGFAVVAAEVRSLAVKSDEAAKATKGLIEDSIQAVKGGSEIANKVADALDQTNTLVNQAVTQVGQIADAIDEETASIAQVVEGIDQISSVVQTNSATSEQSAAASEELSSQAAVMRRITSSFRLRGGAHSAPVQSSSNSNSYDQFDSSSYDTFDSVDSSFYDKY